jgi:hypothetical protein
VKVDIPASLDKEWSLDVKKSTAIIPDDIRKKMWLPLMTASTKAREEFATKAKKKCLPEWNEFGLGKCFPISKSRIR